LQAEQRCATKSGAATCPHLIRLSPPEAQRGEMKLPAVPTEFTAPEERRTAKRYISRRA
jgi:hypothetical protein